MMLRDSTGKVLNDDCPCPGPLKGSCPDCPERAVPWCEKCGKEAAPYFDREVCPPPCDTMHDRCRDCGAVLDHCENEENP